MKGLERESIRWVLHQPKSSAMSVAILQENLAGATLV